MTLDTALLSKTSELKDKLFLLERRIHPLEWDLGRNQINEFKKKELEKLKLEFSAVTSELKGLES
ncbi:hypothetical protein J4437_00110 [Candidatus Woesearchaeota archaeon]|nr:hypothetical protein [Candidatus Woesearchaeota archaeon]